MWGRPINTVSDLQMICGQEKELYLVAAANKFI
jgi:hypothetical protein